MIKKILRPITRFFNDIYIDVKNKFKEELRIPVEASSKYTIEELKKEAFKIHPVSIFKLSGELWKEDKKEEALMWYYIGVLRYRIRLESIKNTDEYEGESHYFEKMEFETKPVFLEWAGGNPLQWAEQINKAIEWDNKNLNMYSSKMEHIEIYNTNIESMKQLIEALKETSDDILSQRKEQGFENRIKIKDRV